VDSGLYVVATPIGNLGDITHRAIEVLQEANLIAAEDTRHSLRLLQHFNIDTPLLAYHDHSGERSREKIERILENDGMVALISDAGTPLISDPGYRLVRDIQGKGYPVRPIPGPSAAVAALSVSGLATDRFMFEGFLPARAGARTGRLKELATQSATLVFYESPHRLQDSLRAMGDAFGVEREAVLARELTKTFETIRRARLGELIDFVACDANQSRGEIVLLVSGYVDSGREVDDATAKLLHRLVQELPAKKAAAVVSDVTGLRKNQLYDYLLDEKSGE
jgi:16S rRNA (cytidine1402-2'-O)-methyltransferase